MADHMNVYPRINFIKYYSQLILKHRWMVLGLGLFLGSALLAFSYIQIFTSSTIFRFQITETTGSGHQQSINLQSLLGKSENVRDKTFNYLHSIPFYLELKHRLEKVPEGQEILKIFSRSKDSVLLKVKGLFFDTFTYGTATGDHQISQALQKVFSFKKDSDSAIVMHVRTGSPGLSVKIAKTVAPMVREIVLENEYQDVSISAEHIKGQLAKSKANLQRLEDLMVSHKQGNQKITRAADATSAALLDMEKELRMARIEVQRHELLIEGIEKQMKATSVYASSEGNYRYIDQVALERLDEIKQARDLALAKVESLQTSYEEFKQEQKVVPASEQIFLNLKFHHELESSIMKDIMLKERDITGLKKLVDNAIRIVGEPTLVPVKFKFSRLVRFVFGLLLGSFLMLLCLHYYYDLFKVVKGNRDLQEFGGFEILTSIPALKNFSAKKTDIWQELPKNHHAMEAFRVLLARALEAKVVAVLGSSGKEGKSFVVSNLAENLVRFGKKVLVIDTNWSRPTLARELRPGPNLVLVDAARFKHGKDAFLDRTELMKVIKEHSKDCDVVLIDTQSLGESNDALVAASVAACSIVVCAYLETYHHKFYDLLKKLEASDVTGFSVVLNKVNLGHEIIQFRGQYRALDEVDTNTLYLKKSS